MPRLVEALRLPETYPHEAGDIELVETHISWVALAGDYAYKLKKPVDLGFLDFSTLEKRHHFCAEELRLNRRLAPDLYLDVVTLRDEGGRMRFGATGRIVEYAVRMRRFEQSMQLDRQLAAGRLDVTDMAEIGERIARFHQDADRASADMPYGSPDVVMRPVRENFGQLDGVLPETDMIAAADRLAAWTEDQFALLRPSLSGRRRGGFVRECHGDLHLRNMARIDGRIVAFDGIEFDPALRWIDVISDCAFLLMDLMSRGRPALGWHFLNRWLEVTGDYASLRLLTWYLVYRHMVRTKVDAIRLRQPEVTEAERTHLAGRIGRHLSQAEAAISPPEPGLVLMWGLSGSGKSWLSERLADSLPAIRVRSDVERKRVFAQSGLSSTAGYGQGLYAPAATDATYERLLELAETVMASGHTVIVDAAFLDPSRRSAFRALAERLRRPWLVVCCEAPVERLRQRVAARAAEGRDPSDAGLEVLERQLRDAREVGGDESHRRVMVSTDATIDVDALAARIRGLLRVRR